MFAQRISSESVWLQSVPHPRVHSSNSIQVTMAAILSELGPAGQWVCSLSLV